MRVAVFSSLHLCSYLSFPPFPCVPAHFLAFALLLPSLLCTPSTAVWPPPGLFVVARLLCDYRLVVRNVNMMSMEVPLSLEWSTMSSIRLMCAAQHQTV